jgi:uncharacterized protein (DUF1810 family)
MSDPFNLERFLEAQKTVYERVTTELRAGRKSSHWMWFIFPQIRGLGHTETSIFFSISSVPEAKAYLNHPVLGPRLHECCELLMQIEGRSASQIFGSPDDLKLRSSMTLFAHVTDCDSIFKRVVKRYFEGQLDQRTLDLLGIQSIEQT